ncbi:MAG: hypothetical protein AAFU71_17560 [Cyanobacteria bacterium J06632_22]
MSSFRRLLPVLFTVCAVGVFVFLGVNLRVPAEAGQLSYVVKETPQRDLIYVEPRFSDHVDLERDQYFKDFDLQALGYIVEEELSQDYDIKATYYHTRPVHGNEVPGLFVFLNNK